MGDAGTLTMSANERNRLEVLGRALERRLTQHDAAQRLDLSLRQVERLCRALRDRGAAGLVSRKRGRPSNHKLPAAVRVRAVDLVRTHYADFGPTFACEKLREQHDLRVSVETLRQWMSEDGIWVSRAQRARRPQPPRYRRPCLGELIQIDGCDHEWFEDRGPRCTLLVYVDDAPSRLMELCFADTESTFDYFHATRRYLERHGKPMAFYSDRLSVFHVYARHRAQGGPGLSQFGRALQALNIDSLCAQSPQAKGRVERANGTLQDRLVKELRLRGLNDPAAADPYLPVFMADYNHRFAQPPRVAHDAHRPLRAAENLAQLFTLQETRRITAQLTVHYKRGLYILEDTVENRRLRGADALVCEAADGTVTLHGQGRLLATRLQHKDHAQLVPGIVAEHKHLDGVFAWIAAQQRDRDAARLANPKLTRREKKRIRAASSPA